MSNILKKIISHKQKEVTLKKLSLPLIVIKKSLANKKYVSFSFKQALLKRGMMTIIAEIKKASPVNGIINPDFNIEKVIEAYSLAGVDAVSVLTDEKFFQGSLENLTLAKKTMKVPLLRKDFIIDEYQIYESKLYGADAILLMVNVLSNKKIDAFINIAHKLNMDCLVEIHNKSELKRVLKTKAEIIGINNRNLKTFEVDIENSLRIAPLVPSSKIIVSESGIKNRQDVEKLKKVGVDAILIGTTLMKSKNIQKTIKELQL